MKQQDWIDFFQAVNGRNPSIQEMAEAAQKGEFVRETPKQTVEVTETVSQKETVETKQDSEVVEPAESAPSTEVVETAEKMLTAMMLLKNHSLTLQQMKKRLSKQLT